MVSRTLIIDRCMFESKRQFLCLCEQPRGGKFYIAHLPPPPALIEAPVFELWNVGQISILGSESLRISRLYTRTIISVIQIYEARSTISIFVFVCVCVFFSLHSQATKHVIRHVIHKRYTISGQDKPLPGGWLLVVYWVLIFKGLFFIMKHKFPDHACFVAGCCLSVCVHARLSVLRHLKMDIDKRRAGKQKGR